MAKLFGMEDGYGGLDNLVLTIKVKPTPTFLPCVSLIAPPPTRQC